jgi:hypothetical protein
LCKLAKKRKLQKNILYSNVGATRMWVGRYWVMFQGQARDQFLHQNVQTGTVAHPASYWRGTEGFFFWVQQPGSECDHSPPSTAEVKNEWNYTFMTSILIFICIIFLYFKDMWWCIT